MLRFVFRSSPLRFMSNLSGKWWPHGTGCLSFIRSCCEKYPCHLWKKMFQMKKLHFALRNALATLLIWRKKDSSMKLQTLTSLQCPSHEFRPFEVVFLHFLRFRCFRGTSKPPMERTSETLPKNELNSAIGNKRSWQQQNNTQSKSDTSIYLYKPKPWRIHECKRYNHPLKLMPLTVRSWKLETHPRRLFDMMSSSIFSHMFAFLILIGSHLLTFVTATSDPDVIHVIPQPVIHRQGTSPGSLDFHYPQEQPAWTARVKMKKCVN